MCLKFQQLEIVGLFHTDITRLCFRASIVMTVMIDIIQWKTGLQWGIKEK